MLRWELSESQAQVRYATVRQGQGRTAKEAVVEDYERQWRSYYYGD